MNSPSPLALEHRLATRLQEPPEAAPGAGAPCGGARRGAFSDAEAAEVSAGVAAGRAESLERLYRAWFDRAFALATAWTRRDEAFCLDAVQEAMMRAIRSLRAAPHAAALDGWMTMAVRSACLDALRREARRLARERRAAIRGADRARAGAGGAVSGEQVDELLRAIDELDGEQGRLIRLRFFSDRTLRETGAAGGQGAGAAHGRIRAALRRLRRMLTEQDP